MTPEGHAALTAELAALKGKAAPEAIEAPEGDILTEEAATETAERGEQP